MRPGWRGGFHEAHSFRRSFQCSSLGALPAGEETFRHRIWGLARHRTRNLNFRVWSFGLSLNDRNNKGKTP